MREIKREETGEIGYGVLEESQNTLRNIISPVFSCPPSVTGLMLLSPFIVSHRNAVVVGVVVVSYPSHSIKCHFIQSPDLEGFIDWWVIRKMWFPIRTNL